MKFEFVTEKYDIQKRDITVYALSTCGFCKRGLQFLRENQLTFRYVYVDQLNYDIKQQLKKDLEEKYNEKVRYPFLVIDNNEVLLGFTPEEWKQKLL